MARVNTSRHDSATSLDAQRHELRALARFLIDLYRTGGKTLLGTLSASASDVGELSLDDDDRLAAQAELLEEIGYSHAYAERAVLSNRREHEARM